MSFNPFDIAEQQYKSGAKTFSDPVKQEMTPPPATSKNVGNDPAAAYDPFAIAQQQMQQPEEESWWDATMRNISRTGSRMVETIMGLPGDVYNFAKESLANYPLASSGLVGELISQGVGKDNWKNAVRGQQIPGMLGAPQIGQQDLQNISQYLSKGYTAPQGKGEETSDEVFKTLTNLMIGGGGRTVVQGATRLNPLMQQTVKFGRNLGQAIASESAKEGIKLYGGSEDKQELGKMATLMLTSMTLPRLTQESRPDRYLGSLYKERDALIPPGTMVTPTGLEADLKNFINRRIRYGGPTPEKTQVGNIAEQFLDRIQGRGVPMDELLQMYRDVNRNRANVMMADLDKPGIKNARRYYGEMANMFNDSIEGYLGSINPEALRLHRAANSGWAALESGSRVSNFVMDKLKSVPLKTGLATLFGGGIFYDPVTTAKTLAGTGIAASAGKGGELIYRFMTNPTLRHYYNQVIMNALQENAAGTINSIKKLDNAYYKELKNPKSNILRHFQETVQPEQLPQPKKNPREKATFYNTYDSYAY